MKTVAALAFATALLPAAALAAPTAAQKDEFYAVCMDIAQNETLCACKADAAMTLIDETFMTMVIGAMQGGPVPADDHSAYNAYIAKSNQVCLPGY